MPANHLSFLHFHRNHFITEEASALCPGASEGEDGQGGGGGEGAGQGGGGQPGSADEGGGHPSGKYGQAVSAPKGPSLSVVLEGGKEEEVPRAATTLSSAAASGPDMINRMLNLLQHQQELQKQQQELQKQQANMHQQTLQQRE